jgi:hypothetical protein
MVWYCLWFMHACMQLHADAADASDAWMRACVAGCVVDTILIS